MSCASESISFYPTAGAFRCNMALEVVKPTKELWLGRFASARWPNIALQLTPTASLLVPCASLRCR